MKAARSAAQFGERPPDFASLHPGYGFPRRQEKTPGRNRELRNHRPPSLRPNVEPSRDLQVLGRGLASIADDLIFDHLALVESAEASAFYGRNVDEYVLVSGRWLDEPGALSRIEPLDGALLHRRSPGLKPVLTRSRNAAIRATTRFLGRSEAVAPRRRSAGSQNQIADRANTKNWALARPIALSRRRSQVACAS